jgi:hypothetical protein
VHRNLIKILKKMKRRENSGPGAIYVKEGEKKEKTKSNFGWLRRKPRFTSTCNRGFAPMEAGVKAYAGIVSRLDQAVLFGVSGKSM